MVEVVPEKKSFSLKLQWTLRSSYPPCSTFWQSFSNSPLCQMTVRFSQTPYKTHYDFPKVWTPGSQSYMKDWTDAWFLATKSHFHDLHNVTNQPVLCRRTSTYEPARLQRVNSSFYSDSSGPLDILSPPGHQPIFFFLFFHFCHLFLLLIGLLMLFLKTRQILPVPHLRNFTFQIIKFRWSFSSTPLHHPWRCVCHRK